MPIGSGLLSKSVPATPHLLAHGAGGVAGEVADLRADLLKELSPMAAIAVEEWTNPLTAAPAGLLAATASSIAAQTVLAAAMIGAGKTEILRVARNVTFTTAGGTPGHAPSTALVTGFDASGKPQTETVSVAQTAASTAGVKCWSKITSIVYGVGTGTGATVSIGYGLLIGLTKTMKARAGLTAAVKEIANAAVVTTGTFNAANRSYTPATAPDGTKSYAVYYEYDATVTT